MSADPMTAAAGAAFIITTLIMWLLIFAGLAVGNGYIAARLGKSVPLWVVLSLIPGFNLCFLYYVFYFVICRMLNRLDQIAVRVDAGAFRPV